MRSSVLALLNPLYILIFCITAQEAFASDIPYEELNILNEAINNSTIYRDRQYHRIDSIRRSYGSHPDKVKEWEMTYRIASDFRLINTDSAIFHAESAYIMAERLYAEDRISRKDRILSVLNLVDALAAGSIYTVAKSNFEVVGRWEMPDSLKVDYWKTGYLLYSYMASTMGAPSPYTNETKAKVKQYADSLLRSLDHKDVLYKQLYIERLIERGQYAEARNRSISLLKHLGEDRQNYGKAALQLASIYQLQGDQYNYAVWLARSATSDIRAGINEGMALPSLSNWLYEREKIDDAYRYINFALEDAVTSSARVSTQAIAQLVPSIDQAYRKKINDSKNLLLAGFVISFILLLVTVSLVFILVRQNKQAHQARLSLDKISKIQESYVGNFIALCSSYANRLDSLAKLVGRKLSSGQADELLKMVNSGRLQGEHEDEDFYKLFDNAFLDMYPNFVANINSLLRPDRQIAIRPEQGLTPELRIYAFVKLGVDESVKIAQIMRYSVSTVYAYRNRMRNRAINRENFDKSIAEIGR